MADIDIGTVREFAFFKGLAEEQLGRIVACGEVAGFESGAVIFEESSQSQDLYIVLSGRVCVEIESPASANGQNLQLALLREGEVFGEIAFLGGTRRSARICALDDVTALRLDGAQLSAMFDEDSAVGYRVMRNLAVILSQRVVDVNFKWRQDRANALG